MPELQSGLRIVGIPLVLPPARRSHRLPAGKSREAGVALGANVPLAMRGPAEVASWSPTKIAALDEATLARITDLYARDPRRFGATTQALAIARDELAAAEEEWLTLEMRREEIDNVERKS